MQGADLFPRSALAFARPPQYAIPVQPPSSPTALGRILADAWAQNALVKVVLSGPRNSSSQSSPVHPLRVKARPVRLRSVWKLCVVTCFARSEETKNVEVFPGIEALADAFVSDWAEAHVFTLTGDYQLRRDALGREKIRSVRAAFVQMPDPAHDKPKPFREEISKEPFLQHLGVTQGDGKPRASMAGKLRQITRFVEVLGHLFEECGWSTKGPGKTLRIADMGAGKGYLTFALAAMLRVRGWASQVVGVEMRPELVEHGNALAKTLGWNELRFEAGSIGSWSPSQGLDVLVALHACDTATDDALFQGVRSGATLLVTSPCCHKELRPQLCMPPGLASALGHGILEERFAELLTDGIRALALERAGYSARVFEFVDSEHSGKNLMLSAVRRAGNKRLASSASGSVETLLQSYGITRQRLVDQMRSSGL